MRSAVVVVAVALAGALPALAQSTTSHGLSIFGELKYGPDFQHFDYVNPEAPKGGAVRLGHAGSFDNLNPLIVKGTDLRGMGGSAMLLPVESLMVSAQDEPDSMYGLVAEAVELAEDRSWVEFTLRSEARWHDGSPITADDVVFSFETLVAEGEPGYRLAYRDVERVEALAIDRVRFTFTAGATRDLPNLVAGMPILSNAYYTANAFNETTLDPPMGSGPYRFGRVDQGRVLVYERVKDYWARELPVNRGRYNFDTIRYDFYRDRTIEFEAFKAGEYDFREEFTSKTWATGYDSPAVRDGLIRRETLPDESPSGTQAFFLNTRLAKFADRRVREALDYAFDFEWTNENLFFGLYDRTTSMFENSDLRARGPISDAERALLEPFRAELPEEVFGDAYAPPATDGSGNIRAGLMHARALLDQAGWTVAEGRLVDASGTQMAIEFMIDTPLFERIIAPYVANLGRLGIDARIRIVDSAQFMSRVQTYDYDVMVSRFTMRRTPGVEHRNFWGSAAADSPGGNNLAGVRDPAVDALIERLGTAESRAELKSVVGALDRVLTWNHYTVPQWFKASHFVAYWDKFGRPETKPRFDLGFLDTWWVDPVKEAALEMALGRAPE